MWFLGVLCWAIVVSQSEGLRLRETLDQDYERPCVEDCSAENAEDCCLLGEPFGEVEREARIGISTANETFRKVEELLLEFNEDSDEQQEILTRRGLMETVLRLSRRNLRPLCGVKLKLARFATHSVVGVAAKRIYNTVRDQGILLVNIIMWATDEIAGEHRPPPTIYGFGPCGGRWPCQPTLTCTEASCEGGSESPFILPMTQTFKTNRRSMPHTRSTDSYSDSYTPNLRLPLPESPYSILPPRRVPGNNAERKEYIADGYGIPSENEPSVHRERSNQEVYGTKSSHQQRPQKRVQLPENYYKSRNIRRIPKYSDKFPEMVEVPNPYLSNPRVPRLFDEPPKQGKRRSRNDRDKTRTENGAQLHHTKNDQDIFANQDQHSSEAREIVDPSSPWLIKIIGLDFEDNAGVKKRVKGLTGIPRAYKVPQDDIPDQGSSEEK